MIDVGRPGLGPAAEALFFASPKKSTQKKGDPTSATPALSAGANLRRGYGGVGRRTHFAAAQRRSDNCGQSEHEAAASFGAAATPPEPRRRRSLKGLEDPTRAIAALGPHRASAARREPRAERSDGPSRLMPLWTCREAQSGRWVRAAQHARASCADSLQLFERSANGAQRVLQRHRPIEHRRLPRSEAQGTRPVGSPFFCLLFFGDQRKEGAPPGAVPGLPTSFMRRLSTRAQKSMLRI